MEQLGIGLLGCGTVGGGVARLLMENATVLKAHSGSDLKIHKIAVRNIEKPRDECVDRKLLTDDARSVVHSDEVQVIVELMGGCEEARVLVLEALRAGKSVVTANKALLARHGKEIFDAAQENSSHVYFEASVGGGIPIIRSIREGLVANKIRGIYGIINGTSNYILTEMARAKQPFDTVLQEAQEKGYAEAESALDVDGHDAADKLSVLAACAYGLSVSPEQIFTEGIAKLTPQDFDYAKELGFVIKPLAIATESGDQVTLRVHPAMIAESHLLATVDGVYNAVYVVGDPVGHIMLFGRGAGAGPTASAVVGDLVEAVRDLVRENSTPILLPSQTQPLSLGAVEEVECSYYLRCTAMDQPGVLSKITGALGEHGISMSQVLQHERHEEKAVPVILLTHPCKEHALIRAVSAIDALSVSSAPTMVVRVEALGMVH